MIVLKIIGWVLLGLLTLIIFALCVKVHFRIEYSSENTSAVLRWLFLKFKLYPMKKKEKAKKDDIPPPPKEEKQEEKKEEQPPKQKSNLLKTLYDAEGIDGIITILKQVTGYTKTYFGNLIRGFVIDELYIDVRCTKEDAAATAIYYGEVCAVLFPMLGALASKCRLKKYDFNVYPDFIARFSDASFVTSFHFTPMNLICRTVAYACKLLYGVLIKLVFKIIGAGKKQQGSRDENKNTEEKRESK